MIDAIDLKILNILQDNARTSNAEIARKVGMAPSAIFERIRRLETDGIIQGYEARLDPKKIGMSLVAFVYVKAEEKCGEMKIAAQLGKIPEVQEVHHIAGEDCYLVKVRTASTDALWELLRSRFGKISLLRSTKTTIVLSTKKETARLPLDADALRKES